MTTSAQVLAAWQSAIFSHADIQAETTKVLAYDIAADIANMTEFTAGIFQQKHNFFQILCSRETVAGTLRGSNTAVSRFTHIVEVSYYIEKDPEDADQNYNEAIRVIELLDDLVRSELGKDWSGTVNYYEFTQLQRPQLIDIAGRKVWRVGHTYTGVKTV